MKFKLTKKKSILGNDIYEIRYLIPNTVIENFIIEKTLKDVLNDYWNRVRPELKCLEKLKKEIWI
jgi:hypothetical protein